MYKKIIEEIFDLGGKAYICGGYVRDKILGLSSKDIDIEVFEIEIETFEKILTKYGDWKKAGKQFQVYIFENKYDFSFPRNIENIEDPNITVEFASKRRDFTINSIYYDILNDKILDFNNGISDIENRIIRQVKKNSLLKDPLRMLRAIQFMSRFDFEIEDKTIEQIKKNFSLIKTCDKERIFVELKKILLKSEKPSKAFIFLKKNGLLSILFPELDKLSKIIQDKIYHPEGDVFTHTMMCLDVLKKEEREFDIMLSILWHDIGKSNCEIEKIITENGEMISFKEHAKVSSIDLEKYFLKFSTNKVLLKSIKNLVFYHEAPLRLFLDKNINRVSVKKLAVKTDIIKLLKVYRADVLGRGRPDNSDELEVIEKIKNIYLNIKDELQPIITGEDLIKLGINQGKDMGEMLKKIYNAQLEEQFFNKETGLKFFTSQIMDDY